MNETTAKVIRAAIVNAEDDLYRCRAQESRFANSVDGNGIPILKTIARLECEIAELKSELSAGSRNLPMTAEQAEPLTCCFCGAVATDTQAAIDADWVPSFFAYSEGNEEILLPCCCECGEKHLAQDEHGEMYIKDAMPPTSSLPDSPPIG